MRTLVRGAVLVVLSLFCLSLYAAELSQKYADWAKSPVKWLMTRDEQKQWKSMLGNLKTGDKVTTSGGVRGTIVALRDENVHLRVPPDNIRLEVARSAIVSVATGEEAAKSQ